LHGVPLWICCESAKNCGLIRYFMPFIDVLTKRGPQAAEGEAGMSRLGNGLSPDTLPRSLQFQKRLLQLPGDRPGLVLEERMSVNFLQSQDLGTGPG